jgi:hypothetical protein
MFENTFMGNKKNNISLILTKKIKLYRYVVIYKKMCTKNNNMRLRAIALCNYV